MRLDSNFAVLKAVVIVMGILIVTGFAVVAVEITRRLSGLATVGAGEVRSLLLPSGCTVGEIAGVGERLVMRIEPAESCPDLIYLDAGGREVGRVEVTPEP